MFCRYLYLAAFTILVGAAFADGTYESNFESPGTPAVAVDGDDLYLAWARPDYTIKFGRFELVGGEDLSLEESESLSDRTINAMGLSISDGNLLLSWEDSDTYVYVAYYKLESGGGFKFLDKKGLGKKSSGGASTAIVGARGYVGFVDPKSETVNIAVYDLSKTKLKRLDIVKLTECDTTSPCSIAVVDDVLVIARVNEKGKLSLTTYEIKDSSKGATFTYVKEHQTEERLNAQPALAAGEGEVLAGFVDSDDLYIHMEYFAVQGDGSLTAGTKLRVSEKPRTSIALAVDAGEKIYIGYIDEDGEIALHKR